MENEKDKIKVLFLDIDGVLNLPMEISRWDKPHKPCLDQLFRIIEETDCKIVLSSSWRLDDLMTRVIGLWGIKIYSSTPLHTVSESLRGYRGEEINDWLKGFEKVKGYIPVFAIVDDGTDMEPHMHRFVKTGWIYGLNEEAADKLIGLLNETK